MTLMKRKMMMSKLIVLLSGGLDSVVSLAKVRNDYDEVLALTFDYGQKSFEAEKKASEKIAKFYNAKHQVIKLDWLSKISQSTLNTEDNIPQPSEKELDNFYVTEKSAASVWVPNRNGLFVNIAASFADAFNYDAILIGANKEEGATFKDNTPEFVAAINNSFKNSLNAKVRLIAPLIEMTKQDIIKTGLELKVPFELIHSCYLGEEKHCGLCESCQRLKRALELNNRHDIVLKIFKQEG